MLRRRSRKASGHAGKAQPQPNTMPSNGALASPVLGVVESFARARSPACVRRTTASTGAEDACADATTGLVNWAGPDRATHAEGRCPRGAQVETGIRNEVRSRRAAADESPQSQVQLGPDVDNYYEA